MDNVLDSVPNQMSGHGGIWWLLSIKTAKISIKPTFFVGKTYKVTSSHLKSPLPGKINTLDYYIEKCRHEISGIDFNRKVSNTNLTKAESQASKNLKFRNNIVILAITLVSECSVLGNANKLHHHIKWNNRIKPFSFC